MNPSLLVSGKPAVSSFISLLLLSRCWATVGSSETSASLAWIRGLASPEDILRAPLTVLFLAAQAFSRVAVRRAVNCQQLPTAC